MCSDCDADFHALCVKMSKADMSCLSSEVLSWRCLLCAEASRHSMRLEAHTADGGVAMEYVIKMLEDTRRGQMQAVWDFNGFFEDHIKRIQESTAFLANHASKMNKLFLKARQSICIGRILMRNEESRSY